MNQKTVFRSFIVPSVAQLCSPFLQFGLKVFPNLSPNMLLSERRSLNEFD